MVRTDVLVVPKLSTVFGGRSRLELNNCCVIPIERDSSTGMFYIRTRTLKKGKCSPDSLAMPAVAQPLRKAMEERAAPEITPLSINFEEEVKKAAAAENSAKQTDSRLVNASEQAEISEPTIDDVMIHHDDENFDHMMESILEDKVDPQESKMQKIAREAHINSGHTNISDLITISKGNRNNKLWNFPLSFQLKMCHTCALAKSRARQLPKGPVARANYVHERVFMDTTGK
eukprot:3511788-Rhodomonas_salina.1